MTIHSCTSTQVSQTLEGVGRAVGREAPLSAEDVAAGLKEALILGITRGSAQVSQIDGYLSNPTIKIPFPPDVKKVEDRVRQMGLGSEVDRFVTTLNRGAEEAAKEAAPIFVSAIRAMTIEDAWGILKGDQDAATQYLKRTTGQELFARFKPVIGSALKEVNATKYYGDIVSTYNQIPFVEKVNPDLEEYATNRAIDGLFHVVAQEELKIRENPSARTTDLLRRVFGSQDTN